LFSGDSAADDPERGAESALRGQSLRDRSQISSLTKLPRQTKYEDMASITGDAIRGHLETLILSALQKGEAHGFEILRRLEEAGSGALKLKEGSLYPALYRMEAAKLIRGQWEQDSARRGPRRRIYHLTATGRRRLDRARGEFEQFSSVIGRILGVAT